MVINMSQLQDRRALSKKVKATVSFLDLKALLVSGQGL